MKNHKLCYIVEEPSKTKKTRVKKQANKRKIHVFMRCKFYIVWSDVCHIQLFLQITQISVVLFLQSLPEQVLRFLGVGAPSATVALLLVCSLFFGVPHQFFANSLHEHSAAYAGIANVSVNNPAIYECHVYYIIKHMDWRASASSFHRVVS